MSELGVLLKMLDQENLSSSTEEKKMSVWNLLQQIQPQGVDPSVHIFLNKDSLKMFLLIKSFLAVQCPVQTTST